MASSFLGYEYWFCKSSGRSAKIIYQKLGLNQIIGAIGSLITLASVVLALSNTVFGLSESNILTNTKWLFIYFANQWGQVLNYHFSILRLN
jgi:hypothetical protein